MASTEFLMEFREIVLRRTEELKILKVHRGNVWYHFILGTAKLNMNLLVKLNDLLLERGYGNKWKS